MNFEQILAKLGAKGSGQTSSTASPPPAHPHPHPQQQQQSALPFSDFMSTAVPAFNGSADVFGNIFNNHPNVHIHQETVTIEKHTQENNIFSDSTYGFTDISFSTNDQLTSAPSTASTYQPRNVLPNGNVNELLQAMLGSASVKHEDSTPAAESNDLEDIFNMSNLNEAEYQASVHLPQQQQQQQPQHSTRQERRKKDHNNYIQQQMIPSDILDDLATRFILNMPMDEREDLIRVCFQMETAYWFYLDFYCAAMKHLPKMKLKRFAEIMFEHIPSLKPMLSSFETIMDNWIKYKFSVPCGGAIMLDKSMRFVLLVQGMSKHWSFPKGKKNQEESLMNCAIREVFEETGYDCSDKVNESSFLERKIFESRCRLFVARGVELDFNFSPHVRGEIQKAEWFRVEELVKQANNRRSAGSATVMSRFITVLPFMNGIHKWVENVRKRKNRQAQRLQKQQLMQAKRDRKASNETDATNSSGEGEGGTPKTAMTIDSSISKSPCMFGDSSQLNEMLHDNIQELLAFDNLEPKTIDEIERGMMLERCDYNEVSAPPQTISTAAMPIPPPPTNKFDLSSLFNMVQEQKNLDTSLAGSLWSTDVTFGDSSDYQNSLFEEGDLNPIQPPNDNRFEATIFPNGLASTKLSNGNQNHMMANAFANLSLGPSMPVQQQLPQPVPQPALNAQQLLNVSIPNELVHRMIDIQAPPPPPVGCNLNAQSPLLPSPVAVPAASPVQSQEKFKSAYEIYMESVNRKKEQLNSSTNSVDGSVFTNATTSAQLPFYYSFNSTLDASTTKAPTPEVTPKKAETLDTTFNADRVDLINRVFTPPASLSLPEAVNISDLEQQMLQPKSFVNGTQPTNGFASELNNAVNEPPESKATPKIEADQYNGLNINNVPSVEKKIQRLLKYFHKF